MPAIRPVGHEERLSLVEHLDELRTRIILSIVAFVVAFSFCYWQNDRILDIINKPLDHAHRVDCKATKKADDALERSGCFNEAVGGYLKAAAPALTHAARTLGAIAGADGVSSATRTQSAQTARELQVAAAQAVKAAALTPKASTGRQPVTLGIGAAFVWGGSDFHDNMHSVADYRRYLLNGIAWTAGLQVPRGGVNAPPPPEF